MDISFLQKRIFAAFFILFYTPIMGSHLSDLPTAARNNLLDEVCEFIRDGKTKIDVTTSDGYAALHWAARNDHQNVVAILLAYNADSTITTPQGETAMQLAQERSHNAIVSLLLKCNQQNQSIPAALILDEHYFDSEARPEKVTPKREMESDDRAQVRKDKNRINKREADGDTALHNAVRAERTDLVRDLLQRGAHIDARGGIVKQPLLLATSLGYRDLAKLLEKKKEHIGQVYTV